MPDDQVKPYYLVVEEWNYPNESGREPSLNTYDSKEEALQVCHDMAESEIENFQATTGTDSLPVGWCPDGAIITPKNGLDPYYYYVRIVPVVPELSKILESCKKAIGKEGAKC